MTAGPGEGPLHRELLVQQHPDEQGERVAGEQRVGGLVLGDVRVGPDLRLTAARLARALTASTGQGASSRIRWAFEPRMSLPTGAAAAQADDDEVGRDLLRHGDQVLGGLQAAHQLADLVLEPLLRRARPGRRELLLAARRVAARRSALPPRWELMTTSRVLRSWHSCAACRSAARPSAVGTYPTTTAIAILLTSRPLPAAAGGPWHAGRRRPGGRRYSDAARRPAHEQEPDAVRRTHGLDLVAVLHDGNGWVRLPRAGSGTGACTARPGCCCAPVGCAARVAAAPGRSGRCCCSCGPPGPTRAARWGVARRRARQPRGRRGGRAAGGRTRRWGSTRRASASSAAASGPTTATGATPTSSRGRAADGRRSHVRNDESDEIRWVALDEVGGLPLHPALAAGLGRAARPARGSSTPPERRGSAPVRPRGAPPSSSATAPVSMRKPSWPYGESITRSGAAPGTPSAISLLQPQRVEPVGVDAGDQRCAAVTRASAAATPPRPRPTSWGFIASVSTM